MVVERRDTGEHFLNMRMLFRMSPRSNYRRCERRGPLRPARRLLTLLSCALLWSLLLCGCRNDLPSTGQPATDPDTAQVVVNKEPILIGTQEEQVQPSVSQVKQLLADTSRNERLFAARDPRLRGVILRSEGGSQQTEQAVERGLMWLAGHQRKDGSWSLDRFFEGRGCTCGSPAKLHSDSAATSLALLAFLGNGQSHRGGRHKERVLNGLNWLLNQQKANGDLRGNSERSAGMYAHAQGTMLLCEALALSGDSKLTQPAQKAIDFLLKAQHASGGWRYRPGDKGDTSVTGWQLAALQAGEAVELSIPAEPLVQSTSFLDTVQDGDASFYAYQSGRQRTNVMTAEALLARIHLGWSVDDPRLQRGVEYLLTDHLPTAETANIYYWYHATQLMHQVGGPAWEKWNPAIQKVLLHSQETTGHTKGSWSPGGHYDAIGGRLCATALAICTLETYYRHAPSERAIDVD